ncbi:zinc-dependent alcohol dehydrogenase family protein [Puniceibacterium sp. IMCC21224]|uniref:zinc-dependent alcohol dehydrogenase family protein n=1 Tax=Puniceibacterium sp. IMCC21224 TaxID=1618204 RepID=UPI00065DBC33|nr:zinc-dependent alcohol dehydrogenase family protein [Puniceibacterium sp. IMCC21224]KMK64541.1 Zn-dependent oxidoreductase, NADPH:quinone reductase [Puniceibacterium sp. IMCC21224]
MADFMTAQVLQQFGGPEEFKLREIPLHNPQPGEVLVRIAAASLNPADTKIRQNGPAHAPELPAVLGLDMSGTVLKVGDGVTGFVEGDRVFGCCGGVRGVTAGTMSTHICADHRLLALAPKTISLRDAAALPLVSITAWEAVVERAAFAPGETALIFGGTGGVGHIALQLARWRGAYTVTTAGDEYKATLARDLGADEVVNYRDEPLENYVARLTKGRGFDQVLDAVGGPNLAPAFEAARTYGTVTSISTRAQYDLTTMHARSLTLHVIFMLIRMIHDIDRAAHGKILGQIAGLVDAGELRPLIDPTRFGLADLAGAHRHLEAGSAVGKIIIDMPENH